MLSPSSLAFLKRLLDTPAPSGYEGPAARVWREEAATFAEKVSCDVAGNSIAEINPGGSPTIMLDGHIDKIGLIVQYIDDDGTRKPVDSGMVKDYLRDAMGDEFTAKDFRTWGGTLSAIALLAKTPLPESGSERAFASPINDVVRSVSEILRNTPAVCRKCLLRTGRLRCRRRGCPRGHRRAAA